MSKVLREFISIVDADCEQFGGIMDEINEPELAKCSADELGKIKKILDSLNGMITMMIVEKHIKEAYDRGFKDGKLSMLESIDEPLM